MNRGRMELSVFGGICWGMETNELSWLWGGYRVRSFSPSLALKTPAIPNNALLRLFGKLPQGGISLLPARAMGCARRS